MNVFIFGRGVIATRLKKKINEFNNIRVVNNYTDANIIFLAHKEEEVESWIANRNGLIKDKICYDFSGVSKRRGVYCNALNQILQYETYKNEGIISLPGCFASSIMLPVLYLKERYNINVKNIWSSALGGRSTLGESKSLKAGSARLASNKSCNKHILETSKALNINSNNISLTLMVADLNDGIITKSLVFTEQKLSTQKIGISFEDNRWKYISIADVNIHHSSSNFTLTQKDDHIEVVSYIHNLDFPIDTALMHINETFLKEKI